MNGLDQAPPATVYWPTLVADFIPGEPLIAYGAVAFAVRTSLAGSPALARQIEQAVWSVNSSLPVASLRTMQEIYDGSLGRTSFTLVMLVAAAGAALVLGVVGLYGVLSYVVSTRRREIAIRFALGARTRDVQPALSVKASCSPASAWRFGLSCGRRRHASHDVVALRGRGRRPADVRGCRGRADWRRRARELLAGAARIGRRSRGIAGRGVTPLRRQLAFTESLRGGFLHHRGAESLRGGDSRERRRSMEALPAARVARGPSSRCAY